MLLLLDNVLVDDELNVLVLDVLSVLVDVLLVLDVLVELELLDVLRLVVLAEDNEVPDDVDDELLSVLVELLDDESVLVDELEIVLVELELSVLVLLDEIVLVDDELNVLVLDDELLSVEVELELSVLVLLDELRLDELLSEDVLSVLVELDDESVLVLLSELGELELLDDVELEDDKLLELLDRELDDNVLLLLCSSPAGISETPDIAQMAFGPKPVQPTVVDSTSAGPRVARPPLPSAPVTFDRSTLGATGLIEASSVTMLCTMNSSSSVGAMTSSESAASGPFVPLELLGASVGPD